jgi:predicted secreted acid phosphatase
MRITTLIFVCALLLAGCKDQASQPANASKPSQNTINSTVVQQSSDSELLKYEKEKDAKAAEDWKNALKTDKLENRQRETGKHY